MTNLQTQKLVWEQQIKIEYDRYKIFIGNNNMPKYKVKFVDRSKNKISYAMESLSYKRPVILNVNMGFMINGKNKHCQPTLYHEFTHMWDTENLFSDKDFKERKSVLSLYTEYHASQIESFRFMEFESINSNKIISPSDKFHEFDNFMTAFEYYDEKCKLLSESIVNYDMNTSTNNYKAVIDSYMYVFGIKSVYDKYIEPIDLPHVDSCFHQYLVKLYQFLQEYPVTELWEILLKNVEVLDKLHILNSLESK